MSLLHDLAARFGAEVDVHAAARELGIARQHLVGYFKTLDKAGYGKFLCGRRGRSSRFIINTPENAKVLEHVS